MPETDIAADAAAQKDAGEADGLLVFFNRSLGSRWKTEKANRQTNGHCRALNVDPYSRTIQKNKPALRCSSCSWKRQMESTRVFLEMLLKIPCGSTCKEANGGMGSCHQGLSK